MWSGNLARTWATLPAETRKAIAEMPVTWALTLAVWTDMLRAVREQVKATYAQMDVVYRSGFIGTAEGPISSRRGTGSPLPPCRLRLSRSRRLRKQKAPST